MEFAETEVRELSVTSKEAFILLYFDTNLECYQSFEVDERDFCMRQKIGCFCIIRGQGIFNFLARNTLDIINLYFTSV